MSEKKTRDPANQVVIEVLEKEGLSEFGLMSNQVWHDDPRRLVFLVSRYKFISKMLSGSKSVLEIGCADAFGTRIVLQEVGGVTAIDYDPVLIESARSTQNPKWKFECRVHDILEGPVDGLFDGAYSTDVLEHIDKKDEDRFISNICASITEHAPLIIGTPTIHSQQYASAPSRIGHINCKDYKELRDLMRRFFHNVFIFSMNDEVVHTGFGPMAHYFFALCCSKK